MGNKFPRRIISEKIFNIKCDYCKKKKRDAYKVAEYKIYHEENKTLCLCTKCYREYEKIHNVQLKKVMDFSSYPLVLPDKTFLMELRKYWKSFREFGNEKYLDFRKDTGYDFIDFLLLFEKYKRLSDDEKKEFQISYKISQYAPSIPMVVLDWENGKKIGFSHSGEIICKISSNGDILLYHKHYKKGE